MRPPFDECHQLHNAVSESNTKWGNRLPGQPAIDLSANGRKLYDYLEDDLRTTALDDLAPYLWLISTQSGSNISPLHHQKIKRRQIILTEDPRLHLVWNEDRIFVKPLPKYLLSYEFWTRFMIPEPSQMSVKREQSLPPYSATCPSWIRPTDTIVQAAKGLLRSYAFLVKYESDFELARLHQLLPPSVTFEQFCDFKSRFLDIEDEEVSPRYSYGELRLTRLNMLSKLLLCQWSYEPVHHQSYQYFQQFYGPLLFVFGCFSVILGAMQVEMAVESVTNYPWTGFWTFCRYFSIFSISFIVFNMLVLAFLFSRKLIIELTYAATHSTALPTRTKAPPTEPESGESGNTSIRTSLTL
ncbi:MAG: hypothetical protein MMC33_008540 [Icmadophila ericetorum]|nr:hypothetical protein [Icmadophila ericetorum]